MIYFYNGLAGSGKTHEACKLAAVLVSKKQRVMIVSPTVELQYEIGSRLKRTPFKIINQAEQTGQGCSVTAAVDQYITRPTFFEVLIITHSAFKNITNFPNKKDWTVFIDEEMDPVDFITFNTSDSMNYLFGNDLMNDMEKVSLFKSYKEGFTGIKKKSMPKKDVSFLKSICYGSEHVYPPFQKFLRELLNSNVRLYADSGSLMLFKLGSQDAEIWSELNVNIFQGFKNLYFMGAHIEKSKLFAYLKLKNVVFQESSIPKRFETHDQPIEIFWMTPNQIWSKNYYNSPNSIAPSTTNFELYDALVGNSIGTEAILLQNNKDNPWKHIQHPVQMPYNVKGLNKFANYHNYSESGAYLWSPAYQQKLTSLGFDVDELLFFEAISKAYQGFLRSSVRNGGYHNNKVFLPTKKMALYMRNMYFPNAVVTQIDGAENFFKNN